MLFQIIYSLLFPLLFLLYLPFYLVHIIKRGGLTKEYWERIGIIGAEKKAKLRELKNPVWIHAVSVGETIAALTFIKEWQKRFPKDNLVFSCSTSTAYHTAEAKLPKDVQLIYCPIDCFFAVRRTLKAVRPTMLVIFEVEIWPNLISCAKSFGAKVALVNGRMSDKSSKGYAKWSFIFKPLFQKFNSICVQTEEDKKRICRVMGDDPRVVVCDTMKFDQVPETKNADKTAVMDDCFGTEKRVVFVAGSTHPGEEELVCDAYKNLKSVHPELKMVLVPRHCERAEEVGKLLDERGLTYKLSKPEGEQKPGLADVLLVNTTGELMNFYGASDIAYVGKSLAGQTGGHNIIEPAIYGKAILHGLHMENFRQVAQLFKDAQASIELQSEDEFEPALKKLIEDEAFRTEMGKRARGLVDRYRGAIERTLNQLNH
ncbi:MAG: 3-deoxy-D-manno-octulosonic acid transferase [Lentisphaeria bacterium]|nr:3-deoxy-D-manno-octulosonic acid transferase [Victivallales bacterium]MCR4573371.1 3-deoxy-D-manno-octulosonic acid transferase [Lentisphaeria bacterium]